MSSRRLQIALTIAIAGILIAGVSLELDHILPGNTTNSKSNISQNYFNGNYPYSGAGNLTAVATYVSTMTAETTTLFSTATSVTSSYSSASASTATSSSLSRTESTTMSSSSSESDSTTSSASYSFSSPPSGSFTYSPTFPVRILAVNATLNQAGNQSLSFSVEFQNAGNSTIYVVSGGGSSLSSTILSGPVQSRYTPKCEIATVEIPVSSGSSHTSYTPGCWSGYDYVLSQPGTVMVRLTLDWSSGDQQGGVTVITAEFSFD